jgi:uncharacterized protein (TIGR03086 family)
MLDLLATGLNWASERAALAGSHPDAPTPCAEWNVRQVINHASASASVLAQVLAGEEVPASAFDPKTMDEHGIGSAVGTSLKLAADRFLMEAASPGAFERTCQMPMGVVPGMVVANIALLDVVVHGWDLATATGADATIPSAVADAVYGFAQQMVGPDQRGTLFSDPIDVADSADATTRLVRFLGRP